MKTPLRVLLVEDSENDAELVIHELTRGGYDVTSGRVDTADGLVAALKGARWDLTISDFSMPQFSGTAALALLRQYEAEMPFIFVSGTIGEDIAVGAMRSGAHDYIMKGQLKRLVPAVERELLQVGVRRSQKQAEEQLQYLAYHDPLTDLPNRRLLHHRLEQALLAAQRSDQSLALIVLDLDGFKSVNDSLGHYAGDRVLQQMGARLRAIFREADQVARLGGDEFAFVLPRTNCEGAQRAAQKVLQSLKQPLMIDGHVLTLGGSFGIACYPEHGPTAEALLQQADIAMYVAKSGGLGFAIYSAQRDHRAHGRLDLISELRDGIERDQFICEYQPIVSLQTGTVIAVEALARWNHPRLGRLQPSEFIDLAEETGLIEPLTMVLLNKALAEWAEPETTLGVRVAVNLSPRSLRDAQLPDRIAECLRAHNAPSSALELEITESVIMADPAGSVKCLARLREMGVRLAIDDFGTGYSSLNYLRQLPVHVLKIDRSFVMGLESNDEVIVQSAIGLAHNLGLSVVAEGVETMATQSRLRALDCDSAQGWFFSRPGPAADIRGWIAERIAERQPVGHV